MREFLRDHSKRVDAFGEIIETTATSVKLKVKRDRVIAVCKGLLDELPVKSIDVVPIEDIIRSLFARQPGFHTAKNQVDFQGFRVVLPACHVFA